MLRLAPLGYTRFSQANQFEATFGGGEANVAVSLANFGIPVSFVSKLPTHDLGQCAINDLRRYGVDTTPIVRGGERIGIYYLEKGASQRASQVIYDRAHSSISEATLDDFDWDVLFLEADWFHFTGITPALNPKVAAICLKACQKAKEKGITVSCDLNYRKKLWTCEEAEATMTTLMPYVDVLIANEEDAAKVFKIHARNTDIQSGKLDVSGYQDVAKQLTDRFHFTAVAITLRESLSASLNNWAGLLYKDEKATLSKSYALQIVDRVGGGDSFAAGLIYAFLHHFDAQQTIEFAVAASALKHSIEGDYNRVSVQEVINLVQGDGSGRVQR